MFLLSQSVPMQGDDIAMMEAPVEGEVYRRETAIPSGTILPPTQTEVAFKEADWSLMEIRVRTRSGLMKTLNVQASDTICNVMARIRANSIFGPRFFDNPRLFFNEERLPYHRTVGDYNIENGSTLDLIAQEISLEFDPSHHMFDGVRNLDFSGGKKKKTQATKIPLDGKMIDVYAKLGHVDNKNTAKVDAAYRDTGNSPVCRVFTLIPLQGTGDFAEDNSICVMEKLEEISSTDVTMAFIVKAREGLKAIHNLGIVHGDIATGNLMKKEQGGTSVPKFIDLAGSHCWGTNFFSSNPFSGRQRDISGLGRTLLAMKYVDVIFAINTELYAKFDRFEESDKLDIFRKFGRNGHSSTILKKFGTRKDPWTPHAEVIHFVHLHYTTFMMKKFLDYVEAGHRPQEESLSTSLYYYLWERLDWPHMESAKVWLPALKTKLEEKGHSGDVLDLLFGWAITGEDQESE